MPRVRDDTAYHELEAIRKRHGGILRAEDVVEAAESEANPLHKYFEWDDTKAAYEHRLWQARQLIRYVTITVPKYKKPIIAYVSLKADRQEDGGGYRSIVEVMTDADMRRILIREALQDLEVWQRKYQELVELEPIFKSIAKVRAREEKKLQEARAAKRAKKLQPAVA